MKVALARSWCLGITLCCVASGSARASSSALSEGVEAFLQGDFSRASVLLEQAKREAGCRRGTSKRCGRVELFLGLTRASAGATEAARRAFARALKHDSSLRLDPARDKPSLVELFEQVRAKLNAPVPAASSRPTTPPSGAVKPPEVTSPPPERSRLWTWISAGAAVAATAAGVGLALSAAADDDEACGLLAGPGDCSQRTELLRPEDRPRYQELHDRGSTKTTWANVAWVTAGVLAAGSLVLFWVERRPSERQSQASWSVTPLGLTVRY